ncbi:MAG TPA: hypothetical protein VKY85_27935 [Candidatus Angelobacter sp.]|nr:hypothetical protein [Candidatus Angelobacter sp.]
MAMLTDAPPRKPNLKFFVDSDRLKTVPLPDDGRLVKIASAIEVAMKTAYTTDVRQVWDDFLGITSDSGISMRHPRACHQNAPGS